ncbi:MAG: heavy metal-binding domain-containing protein, partial [Acidobacteria bacterium]|nr:heavy metal-binding domain-containing protein [Acidobacteriota bacterium]
MGFTCPMHPEVQAHGPGACPDCGMVLEPAEPQAHTDNPELADMTRRLWVSVALGLPVFLAAMIDMLPGHPISSLVGTRWLHLLELAFTTPVVLWCGWPFLQRGWVSVLNRRLNMFTLVSLGTGSAYVASVMATLVPDWFPPSFRSADGQAAVYFEAAAVITILVLLGQMLELRSRQTAGAAIRELLQLAPT